MDSLAGLALNRKALVQIDQTVADISREDVPFTWRGELSIRRSPVQDWDVSSPNASFNWRARNGGFSPLAAFHSPIGHLKVTVGRLATSGGGAFAHGQSATSATIPKADRPLPLV
jgi:hypothetical protein